MSELRRAVTPLEKAADQLFNSDGYRKVIDNYKLEGADSDSGGGVSDAGVAFTHRRPYLHGGGQLYIEVIPFKKALTYGKERFFGNTLIVVEADEPVRKEIFATVGK